MFERLSRLVLLTSFLSCLFVQAASAEKRSSLASNPTAYDTSTYPCQGGNEEGQVGRGITRVLYRQRPVTKVKNWLAQGEAETIQVTDVQLNRTQTGLEIVLDTQDGKLLPIDATKFRAVRNTLIADIPNAVLALPEGKEFQVENPTDDIANVRVTQLDATQIRVSVAGKQALPITEVILITGELAYILNPEGEEPDEEIVVTGEGASGYRISNATTGTRLDVPLLETPASIGVIPEELIEDRAARRGEDLIPYISGVTLGGGDDFQGGLVPQFTIRGFSVARQVYLNGLRENTRFLVRDLANIDRIEILKGFSSLLYGTGAPGGVVNYITKKPQATPSYTVSFEAGSFNFYRGEIDLTGPLIENRNLLYRFIVGLQKADSFYDNVEDNRILIAPSLTWLTGNGGSLNLEAEYLQQNANGISGIKFFNDRFFFDRSYNDSRDDAQRDNYRISGYFAQPLGKNWSINLSGQYFYTSRDETLFRAGFFEEEILNRFYSRFTDDYYQTNLRGEVRGNFKIGASEHKLLAGVEYNRLKSEFDGPGGAFFGSIDVANPTFDVPVPKPEELQFSNFGFFEQKDWGVYIQDFVTLGQFRLLGGLRYGKFEGSSLDETNQEGDFVSPSVGLVYKLTDSASLYASFSQSTEPQRGLVRDGGFIEPKKATQYEIGAKVNLLNDRLSLTTALFNLTQTNIAESDPADPDFVIPVGDVRTRGLELDVTGRIAENFNLIAAYTHFFEADIIKSTEELEGNRFNNVPRNTFGLYGKYTFTDGALEGLSLGAGVVYVGEREGDIDNSFEVPSYTRVDLGAAYQINNVTFGLAIENLFDIRYVASSSDRANIAQGSPFAITGSVKVEF
ncbi:TonB-dependent siderophore receptor [Pleurocapsales cyanobacterium LEGE 06147]|nr:TonB-dependent siderophore receptor [Pleurocapsales cyanobacterium LEGE 06147]